MSNNVDYRRAKNLLEWLGHKLRRSSVGRCFNKPPFLVSNVRAYLDVCKTITVKAWSNRLMEGYRRREFMGFVDNH